MLKKKRLLRKILSVSLCAALLGGTALTLPAVVQDSGIVVNAATHGDFEYVENDDGGITIIRYSGDGENVSIPSVIDGKNVTSIGTWVFESHGEIKSVYIPETVTTIGWAAFYSCTGLASVSIPNSVTLIGSEAFEGCTELTDVIIGRGVTKINDSAFDGCTSLTSAAILNRYANFGNDVFKNCADLTIYATSGSTTERYARANRINFVAADYLYKENNDGGITITKYLGDDTDVEIPSEIDGKSVTKIGDEAFWNYTDMTSVTIPEGVTSIGIGTFWTCSGLTSVTLPESLTEIGLGAFYGCSGLKNVTIPKNVTKIDTLTFYQCTGLENVTVLGTVTEIGASAFNYCSSIKSIEFPDTLKTIGASAFSGTALEIFKLPNGVTSIGNNAFSNCSSLKKLYILSSDAEFGTNVFLDTPNVTICGRKDSTSETYANRNDIPFKVVEYDYYVDTDGSVVISNYLGNETHVSIPSEIDGRKVTVIGAWSFTNHNEIASVYIPETVTKIRSGAFYSCTGLTSVSIPNSVNAIESSAFSGCTGLTDVTVGRGVSIIYSSAFKDCTSLTSVAILNSKTSFETDVFQNCSDLTLYAASGSTTEIYARENRINFIAADYLYEENDDGGITITKYLGDDKDVVIPSKIEGKSVTKIGDEAFWKYTDMTSVTIPEGVTSIGIGSFWCCSNLTSVTFPDSLTEIGLGAFYGCSELKSVTIPKNVTKIGVLAFYQCTSLENVNVLGTVTEIGASAFNYCSSLKSIEFPDTLTTIGASAFSGTALEIFKLPNGVTSIGNNAFSNCSSLKKLYILSSDAEFGTNVFLDTPNVTICGRKDSTAETYADRNEIPFTVVEYDYYVDTDGSVVISNYLGNETNVTIPSEIDGRTVSIIGAWSFTQHNEITHVTIPETVTKIRSGAFCACTGLTSVSIPDNVNVIESSAFSGCTGLTDVTVGKGVTIIYSSAFHDCSALTSAAILNSKTIFETDVFQNCPDLTLYAASGSTAETYANENNIPFVVTGKLKNVSTVTFSSDGSPANIAFVGEKITLNAAAEGGTGPYTYALMYKKSTSDTWTKIGTKYGTASTGSFTPTKAVTYDVMINVKDSTGAIASKTFKIDVQEKKALTNNSTVSATEITLGEKVDLNAVAEGGTGSYTYALMYKKSTSNTWTKIGTKYGTASTGSFTPTKAVTYDVMINVKDSTGKVSSKTFTINVKAPLKNNTTINSETVKVGEKVVLKGAASGGTTGYKYAFYYKKSKNSTWTEMQPAYTTKSAAFKPGSAVSYDVKSVVMDAVGRTTEKVFTVKVTK